MINRDHKTDVSASVRLDDYTHGNTASVWTVNGPSYLSYNSSRNPEKVTIQKESRQVGRSTFEHTFPAHSVTDIKLAPVGP